MPPSQPPITVGRTVLYVLAEHDCEAIKQRRKTHEIFARGAQLSADALKEIADSKLEPSNLSYLGNDPSPGQAYPAVVVAVWSSNCANLRVLLDGWDDHWATSRGCDQSGTPGFFYWPHLPLAPKVQQIPGTLPIYQSHKQVRAAKIVGITQDDANQVAEAGSDGSWTLSLDDGTTAGAFAHVTHKWYEKHEPKVGGYFVQYADGYHSYSPAEAFESGYARI